MVDFTIRAASENDMSQVRDLLRRVSTCPDKLDWRQFVVAAGPDGAIIGCGQLRRHFDGTRELASVATDLPYRQQGVARAVVEHLLAAGPRPLYATCRKELEAFYGKFGFRRVWAGRMPVSYLLAMGLLHGLLWLVRIFAPRLAKGDVTEVRERVDTIRHAGMVMRLA